MAAGSKRTRGGAHARVIPASVVHAEQEIVLADGDESDGDSAEDVAAEEVIDTDPVDEGDDGREAHDEAVLKTMRGQAIRYMKDKGVVVSAAEEKMALTLFPRLLRLLTSCSRLLVSLVGFMTRTSCKRSLKS